MSTPKKSNESALATVESAGDLAATFDGLPDFTAPEYRDTTATLPRLTPIRDNGSGQFGLFIKAEDAAAVSLETSLDPTEVIYSDGTSSRGYMFTDGFGLCLQPVTPLLAINKDASSEQKKLVAEEWTAQHKGDDRFTAGVLYHALLTDEAGNLLHTEPVQFLAKGATSATLNKAWKDALTATTRLYFEAKRKPYTPLNWEFNRLVIFHPVLAVELAGEKQKSKALVVRGFVQPSIESLPQFLAVRDYQTVVGALHSATAEAVLVDGDRLSGDSPF